MKNKITVEISEGLGNQLFMYSHAYALAKKINYDLYIDNTSGYSRKKNTLCSGNMCPASRPCAPCHALSRCATIRGL